MNVTSSENLPYRPCAGAALFNRDGLIFAGRRSDQRNRGLDAWQLPQGGIDAGETPADAVLRELGEEIGTKNAEIIGEIDEWLNYDLPPEFRRRGLGQKFRGQTQRWFALRFTGSDEDIRLDAHLPVEFDAWRWMELAKIPAMVVPFKRPIYQRVATDFALFAQV
jgi:putative (di)nucleoside polyphosphate hydrolase